MPKYYVSVLNIQIVLEAKDPLDACVKTSDSRSFITCGINWKVSEKGFANHDDDVLVNDDNINTEILKRKKEK